MSGSEQIGRVLRVVAGTYRVEPEEAAPDAAEGGGTDGAGGPASAPEALPCVLAGRLKQDDEERVAVGDRVRFERVDEERGRITAVLRRRSKLARGRVGRPGEQVIAANIDQVGAVFAVREPQPDVRMLDRLLVVAELNRLDAFVVANKTDLAPRAPERMPAFADRAGAGYEVLATSVPDERGLDRLHDRLGSHVTALAGPSGAGKSSLLNALVPGLNRRVAEVSSAAGRGRHTTVNASFVRLPDRGGYVVDTPGLQYLPLWDLAADELAHAFPELRPLLGGCRFNDCRHLEEPGCPVREAVESGEVAVSRYESYRALLEEAEEQARPW